MQTLSSREFNQDTARAKRAANDGPVFITDRGRRAYVLITNAEYERLTHKPQSIVEALAMPGVEDIEFDPPRMGDFARAAEFD
ncbi:MAG: type II toxin-antitoxin system Phd/YefM family antitoxin [Proteobacteria bacterium]|nr:type II toxin-antitoxin system Phd/YefM family antitoxin [Pseudomonadota bacterium]